MLANVLPATKACPCVAAHVHNLGPLIKVHRPFSGGVAHHSGIARCARPLRTFGATRRRKGAMTAPSTADKIRSDSCNILDYGLVP